jgi:hypothetical protein
MKNSILIVMAVFVVLLGIFLYFQDGQKSVNTIPLVPENESRVEETGYGLTYSYPSGIDGYVVTTNQNAPRGDLVFSQSVFDADDYKELTESTVPREAPVSLTIDVYRNPMNLSVREWITQSEESNYRLSPSGTISSAVFNGTEFLTYQYDGLYRADAYVYGAEGYIYLFSNMWDNPESNMKKDMGEVLKTVQFNTPSIPASIAHGDIEVTSPAPNGEVSSPLVVEGRARGTWYFEASFPLVLVDWDGRIIAEGVAQAQGDWMTEDFVPFKGELSFTKPEYNDRGALILKKDNPSGLPEHDDAIEVPIIFK